MPVNEINNLDLFSQLISKITGIESIENIEISFLKEKIDRLSHLLQSNEEINKAREDEILLNQQNENKNEKSNNLEEIKNKNKIKNKKKIKKKNRKNKKKKKKKKIRKLRHHMDRKTKQ